MIVLPLFAGGVDGVVHGSPEIGGDVHLRNTDSDGLPDLTGRNA